VLNNSTLTNQVLVEGDATPTAINASPATVQIAFSPNARNLDNVLGTVTITGGANTPVIINDQNNVSSVGITTYTFTNSGLSRNELALIGGQVVQRNASILCNGVASVTLNNSSLTNQVLVEGVPTPTATINASAATVQVAISPNDENLDKVAST